MRSPISLWRCMNQRSAASSGPGLSRIAAGIADLPTSCSSAASRVSSTCVGERPRLDRSARRELGDVPEVGDEILVLLCEHLQQRVLGVRPAPPRLRALVGVEALIGDVQGLLEREPAQDARRAARAADREAGALFAQCGLRGGQERLAVVGGRRDDELVAADAVGISAAATAAASLRAEASEQGVAGGMSEGVVVGLEAVEIEDAGQRLVTIGRRPPALHVGKQLAAVAEPGERVGRGLLVAAPARPDQVVEGDREGQQQGHDRDDRADRARRCASARRRRRSRRRPDELGVQPRLDAAGLLALAEQQRRLRRVSAGDEGGDAIDEAEVASAGGGDAGRRVAATVAPRASRPTRCT